MSAAAAQQRAAMVARLLDTGIDDPAVLAAMAELPRERFVPTELAARAYVDEPLEIGYDQTISAPWIVAVSAAALTLRPTDHVLEIGTGSGYGAAVLSRCCASVVTVERHPRLAATAAEALSATGCDNVEVRVGDGYAGVPDEAPFDGVVVTAMAQDRIPPALIEQLAPGRTLVCPVGSGPYGHLLRYRDEHCEPIAEVTFVPLVAGRPAGPRRGTPA